MAAEILILARPCEGHDIGTRPQGRGKCFFVDRENKVVDAERLVRRFADGYELRAFRLAELKPFTWTVSNLSFGRT